MLKILNAMGTLAVNPATGDDMKTVIYGGIIAVAIVLFISISLIKRSKK